MCTTIEDIEEVDRLLVTIAMKTRRELVRMSGCPEPCSYMEYGTSGDPLPTGSGHGIIITFNTKEMAVQSQVNIQKATVDLKSQVEVYPFPSLLAEFGGALSLFTGFSFMLFPDFISSIIMRIKGKLTANRVSETA